MRCPDCKKPIVLDSDWGDYDDACEWACRCHSWSFNELKNEVVMDDFTMDESH